MSSISVKPEYFFLIDIDVFHIAYNEAKAFETTTQVQADERSARQDKRARIKANVAPVTKSGSAKAGRSIY
jgi:hypothetical protein